MKKNHIKEKVSWKHRVLLNMTYGSPASQETVYGTGFHAQHRLKAAAFVNKGQWTNNT